MSFENLAEQITTEWVTDLKTHRHLRNGWDQMSHAERSRLIEHWRALVRGVMVGDAQRLIAKYAAYGLDSQEATAQLGDAVKTLLEKEISG